MTMDLKEVEQREQMVQPYKSACSAKSSMCSRKCTDAVSGEFAGAGTVRNAHCAVCRVQCAACQRWKFSS